MNRLYRSRSDRMIFGVAGGMARYFNVDVALVRLLWVLLLFAGVGVPAYLLAALVIPSEPEVDGADAEDRPAPNDEDRTRTLGWILLILGAAFLLRRFVYWLDWDDLWPAALILLGVYLVFGRSRSR